MAKLNFDFYYDACVCVLLGVLWCHGQLPDTSTVHVQRRGRRANSRPSVQATYCWRASRRHCRAWSV